MRRCPRTIPCPHTCNDSENDNLKTGGETTGHVCRLAHAVHPILVRTKGDFTGVGHAWQMPHQQEYARNIAMRGRYCPAATTSKVCHHGAQSARLVISAAWNAVDLRVLQYHEVCRPQTFQARQE